MRYGYREHGTLTSVLSQQTEAKRIGLLFYHGIGDCCMFMASVRALSKDYPNHEFVVLTLDGQHQLFHEFGVAAEAYQSDEAFKGDLIYDVTFPMADGKIQTKNDLCCQLELGISPVTEDYYVQPTNDSKLVAVHYHNTCLPGGANPDEATAHMVWEVIREAGYIPIEVHFLHAFANPDNIQFNFVDFTTRKMECTIRNLLSVLNSCHKFIGVNSGPYFCALRTLGINNVMMLEKSYTLESVVKDKRGKATSIRGEEGDDLVGDIRSFLGG